ncbi:MAG: type IX secretion system membrane protein PorP/SprF, partial [Bacteroidota bacterium]
MKTYFVWLAACLCASFCYGQWLPQFIQPMDVPLSWNPGLAGSKGAGRFTSAFQYERRDYGACVSPLGYYGGGMSYDTRIRDSKMGWGISGEMFDRTGAFTASLTAVVNRQFRLGPRLVVVPGIQFGLRNFGVEPIDVGHVPPGETSVLQRRGLIFGDIGAGLALNFGELTAGVAVQHLLDPSLEALFDPSLIPGVRLQRQWVAHAEYRFRSPHQTKWEIRPSVWASTRYGGWLQGNVAGRFRFLWLGAGLNSQGFGSLSGGLQLYRMRLLYTYGNHASRE